MLKYWYQFEVGGTMRPILLSPMAYGKQCEVMLPNGKIYKRVVRCNKADGFYVVIATRKYHESDMTFREEQSNGSKDDV